MPKEIKLKPCHSCKKPSFSLTTIKLSQVSVDKLDKRTLDFHPLCVYCAYNMIKDWIEKLEKNGDEA